MAQPAPLSPPLRKVCCRILFEFASLLSVARSNQAARQRAASSSVRRIRNVGSPGPTQPGSRGGLRVRARGAGGGRRVKSQTHSAAGSSRHPCPQIQPRVPRRSHCSSRTPQPSSRPCLPHPSRRSAGHQFVTRRDRRALAGPWPTDERKGNPRPAGAAAHCSLRVRARAPPGAGMGRGRRAAISGGRSARACAGFPHAVVRRRDGTTRGPGHPGGTADVAGTVERNKKQVEGRRSWAAVARGQLGSARARGYSE